MCIRDSLRSVRAWSIYFTIENARRFCRTHDGDYQRSSNWGFGPPLALYAKIGPTRSALRFIIYRKCCRCYLNVRYASSERSLVRLKRHSPTARIAITLITLTIQPWDFPFDTDQYSIMSRYNSFTIPLFIYHLVENIVNRLTDNRNIWVNIQTPQTLI